MLSSAQQSMVCPAFSISDLTFLHRLPGAQTRPLAALKTFWTQVILFGWLVLVFLSFCFFLFLLFLETAPMVGQRAEQRGLVYVCGSVANGGWADR